MASWVGFYTVIGGAAAALILGSGLVVFLYSERTVLAALRARPVGEVERPELYRLVRDLSTAARLPQELPFSLW